MKNYYLAIDIGASSGRHILGWVENGKILLEEIYRFENAMITKAGRLCWDHEVIFSHIKEGIKKCKDVQKFPISIGIDTWGVDFVLLDQKGEVLGDMVAYRDSRTDGMDQKVSAVISEQDLYQRTGIEKMMFNTIYQLMAVKEQEPEILEKAQALLLVPDFFHYLLTGNMVNEYTEATTTQLVEADKRSWDYDLIESLGIPKKLFQRIAMPGETLGSLRKELVEEFGFDTKVVLPCSHDTQSAILAVPANDDDFVYISSGTWSLLGVERKEADCSEFSRLHNFTNEGGYDKNICYMRNIMGLWMIQSLRKELDHKYSFAEICEQAAEEEDFPSRVDVTKECFMAPVSMIEAIKRECQETSQVVPETIGELATVIYASLADCYAKTIENIENSTKRSYRRIHILGGGANAEYLNQLTANATKKEVHAGPSEGTALGNLMLQMMQENEFLSKEEGRETIYQSFDIRKYTAI